MDKRKPEKMTMMKHDAVIRYCVVVLFIALFQEAFAQRPKKAVKAYEAAEEAFMKRDYQKAHQQLLKAIMEDPNYAEAWLLEGEVGMETKDYDLAILGYENALASDSMVFPPAAITLARLYDRQGAYKREVALLKWYQSVAKGQAANDAVVAEMLDLATFRDWAMAHPVSFNPQNLGTAVNTKDDEYVNMPTGHNCCLRARCPSAMAIRRSSFSFRIGTVCNGLSLSDLNLPVFLKTSTPARLSFQPTAGNCI